MYSRARHSGGGVPGRTCAARLAGELRRCGGSGPLYRRAEAVDALTASGVSRWPMVWRGQGASATADGSADVRGVSAARTQRASSRSTGEACSWRRAIAESRSIRRDVSGNPAIAQGAGEWADRCAEQRRSIACGLGERVLAQPARQGGSVIV